MREYSMWVGGKAHLSDRTYELRLPYDGSLTARVTEGDDASFEAACEAAAVGASAMALMSNAERSDLLFRVASLLRENASEFSELLTLETGKPIKESRVETDRGQQTLISSAI